MRQPMWYLLSSMMILVLAVPAAEAQQTRQFKMFMSGTGRIPVGMDADGNKLTLSLCGGHSNLGAGKFSCTSVGYRVRESYGPDMGNCPGGLEAHYLEIVSNHIIRFDDGAILYMVPDMDGPNFACVYPSERYGTDTRSWLIVGGSGRFEGATGQGTWTLKGEGLPVGEPIGVAGGSFEGTITLGK